MVAKFFSIDYMAKTLIENSQHGCCLNVGGKNCKIL